MQLSLPLVYRRTHRADVGERCSARSAGRISARFNRGVTPSSLAVDRDPLICDLDDL
jgi:hypothetical protein